MIPSSLRFAPLAILLFLEAWVAFELLGIGDARWSVGLSLVYLANLVFLLIAQGFRGHWARWIGLIALGSTYLAARAFVLGVPLISALVFVSFLIVHVELRILSERFAPLFQAKITREERRSIAGALFRALARLTVASILSVVVPLLAADLAASGVVPVTTIPTAFILSAGLVAVVLLLALLPALEQRTE